MAKVTKKEEAYKGIWTCWVTSNNIDCDILEFRGEEPKDDTVLKEYEKLVAARAAAEAPEVKLAETEQKLVALEAEKIALTATKATLTAAIAAKPAEEPIEEKPIEEPVEEVRK